MEGLRQYGDSEITKITHSHIKDAHALKSHLGILQPTSSKPYIFLSRNLIKGFQQYGDSELAKIIPFTRQRCPCTKEPS